MKEFTITKAPETDHVIIKIEGAVKPALYHSNKEMTKHFRDQAEVLADQLIKALPAQTCIELFKNLQDRFLAPIEDSIRLPEESMENYL
ncbi:hypothetical protein [Spirochaeta cellobiosiphila]|uniref:hypothetical protein n=1 Tax=Spirochaeta cellobiosiphila TaxID=504483 RepID=UPI00040500BD|nr:hypothetical protein [Spirochaeta cellobiosiphila]